ncbi:MAG: CDP-alcohol phosphatidyltransferase family protein [Actinomycetota bacterium]|nr:CDP-alcohol phosphatidyltransferase family protein [Actinomycetota bacterium]
MTERTNLAVGLYAIGAWTDFFDGYIARRTGSITELGRLLDPLADRIFIVALAVALVAEGALAVPLAIAIIGRDIAIVALYPLVRGVAGINIRVNFVGKTATAALLLGLTFLAFSETTVTWLDRARVPGFAFVLLGAVLYWVSGFIYAREALAMARRVSGGTG